MSRLGLAIAAACAAAGLVVPSPAVAAVDLSISAAHDRDPLLRVSGPNTTVYAGKLTLTVANRGDQASVGPVTVTDTLPAGLSPLVNNPGFDAGPVAASGDGWSCAGTSCTRSDPLAPGAAYPAITITVRVANTAPAQVINTATVTGGATASDSIAVIEDACPNGWSSEAEVSFAPPFGSIDSGVINPERPNGCTLLDEIWAGEPFASHGAFVARVDATTDRYLADGLITGREKDAIQSAAARSDVGARSDRQIPNSCANRIAISFDDGPSFYRPQTLQNFRDKQVHGVFFDLGMRAEANPAIERFSVREGHVLLSHTYNHTNMNDLSDAAKIEEVRHNEAVFDALGAPFTFHGIRTPFGSANTHTQEVVSSLGYTYFLTRIETGNDYEPTTTTEQIVNSIVGQLRPGAIVGLHDGAIDTPAGRATTDAVPQIIDQARARGYCFGVVDRTGQVVADRYVTSSEPIPQIAAPVPYNFMERPGAPPDPWFVAPDPIAISATHSPEPFRRGQTGNTLTLTVTNISDQPSDADPVGGSVVTVRDQLPPGLRPTSASGPGWTCSGSGTRTCRRTDTLGPGASYPPITITVDVAADAPATITNSPTVTAHGQGWKDQADDSVNVE
jgi:peptidoglycan/xylan/chitin deacetylase (PgdA/CDA1 family)